MIGNRKSANIKWWAYLRLVFGQSHLIVEDLAANTAWGVHVSFYMFSQNVSPGKFLVTHVATVTIRGHWPRSVATRTSTHSTVFVGASWKEKKISFGSTLSRGQHVRENWSRRFELKLKKDSFSVSYYYICTLYWLPKQRHSKPKVDLSVFWSIFLNIC